MSLLWISRKNKQNNTLLGLSSCGKLFKHFLQSWWYPIHWQTHRSYPQGSSACRVQDIRMSFNPDSRAVNGKAISKEPNLTTNHKLAHGHKASAVCTWQMIRTLGSVRQNQVLWESVVKGLSIQWTDRHDNFVRSICWERRFRPKVLQSGRATDQILPRSDKMLIETGRARASIWHEPLTKLTQNAVWTTRQRELGIRVTNKATAWLATPGETHLFSAVLKTNRGIYSMFVSGVKVSIWNLHGRRETAHPFFYFDCVFPCILRVICKNIISNVLFSPTCQADSRVGTHSCVWTWNFWQCRTSAWPHVDPLDLLFQVQVQEKIS